MPRGSSFLRRCLGVGAFLAPLLALSTAEAQTTTFGFVQQGGIKRDHQDGNRLDTMVNRKDCENHDFFTFTLNPAGLPVGGDYDLEVWMSEDASTECWMSTNQTPGTGVCRQVAQTVTDRWYVDVFVRDIVSKAWGAWDGGATEEVCVSDYEPSVKVTLHFYAMAAGIAAGSVNYDVEYDLLGPGPPGSVNAGIGQNALVVSWKESSNAAEVFEYHVFAEPVSATSGEGGASGDPDAGTDAGTDAGMPTECASNILTPGEPVPDDISKRGTASASSSKAEAKGLTNGVFYAVAVAGVDTFGNTGDLSALACGTPEPVTGFFEAYRAAGGGAGGGYCALGATPSRLSAAAAALAGLALFLRRIRDRTAHPGKRGSA